MGIEPSLKAYEYAKKLNLKIKKLNIDQIKFIGNLKFDVIYSHGVLEHLRKPIDYVKLTKIYLKKEVWFLPLLLTTLIYFNILLLSKESQTLVDNSTRAY